MTASSLLRGTAATVALIAGIFAVAVRFGPAVAPMHHEAAMITLAALFGEDLDPYAGGALPADTTVLAAIR